MQVCPAVFGLDEELGKAMLLSDEPVGKESDLLKEALDSCPIGCINL
jgi:ferredoxin